MKINRKKYILDGSGTEIDNFDINDTFEYYLVIGSATATGNYLISLTGSATENDVFILKWRGVLDITTNGASFSILGQSITANQLLYDFDAICTYNGSSWDVFIDRSETGITTETSNIKNNAVTNAKLAQMTAYTVKANNTASTADPQDVALNSLTGLNYWGLTGNSGTSAGTNFIGTTDNQDLVFKINSTESGRLSNNNTYFGINACLSLSSGTSNTVLGGGAANNLTVGNGNTAIGDTSLPNITTPSINTAIGFNAGFTLINGDENILIGANADVSDMSSTHRIAIGVNATATQDYQFAISDDVTTIRFKGIVYTLPTSLPLVSGVLTCDSSGNLTWS